MGRCHGGLPCDPWNGVGAVASRAQRVLGALYLRKPRFLSRDDHGADTLDNDHYRNTLCGGVPKV